MSQRHPPENASGQPAETDVRKKAADPAGSGGAADTIDDEQRVENAKFATTPPGEAPAKSRHAADLGEAIDAPPTVAARRLIMFPQKPGVVFAFWRLEPGEARLNPGLVLRLGRFVEGQFEVKEEVPIHDDSGSWYFQLDPIVQIDKVFLQIGRYDADGRFATPWTEGIVRVPRLREESPLGTKRTLTSEEFELARSSASTKQTRTYGAPGGSPTSIDSMRR